HRRVQPDAHRRDGPDRRRPPPAGRRHRAGPGPADADGLVERFFSPTERATYRRVAAPRRPAAFLRGWTCKEAVIKAVGTGVLALDGFDVELDPDRPPAVLALRHPAFTETRWAVAVWEPAAGFTAALAVEGAVELGWGGGVAGS